MKKSAMKVNFVKNVIEMTPAFAKAASEYGSEEYKQLIDVRSSFPGIRTEIVMPKKKATNRYKGLTMEYMEKYIREKEQTDALEEFAKMRGMKVEDGKLVEDKTHSIVTTATYGEIKMWFLETFHKEFEAYENEVKEIVEKAKTARDARKAS